MKADCFGSSGLCGWVDESMSAGQGFDRQGLVASSTTGKGLPV